MKGRPDRRHRYDFIKINKTNSLKYRHLRNAAGAIAVDNPGDNMNQQSKDTSKPVPLPALNGLSGIVAVRVDASPAKGPLHAVPAVVLASAGLACYTAPSWIFAARPPGARFPDRAADYVPAWSLPHGAPAIRLDL